MEAITMPEKPSKVATAVVMLYVSVGIGIVAWLADLPRTGKSIGLAEYVTVLTLGTVFFWLIYVIGHGKNWSRIAALVMIVPLLPFAVLSLVLRLGHTPLSISLDVGLIILDLVGVTLELVALIFLFQKDSSDWFKAMKNFQPLPFRAEGKTTTLDWPGQKDLENLIARIKTELGKGTAKGTLIRTLVKNGWDQQEASQFVKQIAYEMTTNPEDVSLVIKRYKNYMLIGAAAATGGLIAILYGASGIPLAGIIFVLWGFVGWMTYRGRLRPVDQTPVNRAITFRPSKGNLQFTKKSMSLVLRISIAVFAALCLFFLVLGIAAHICKYPQ